MQRPAPRLHDASEGRPTTLTGRQIYKAVEGDLYVTQVFDLHLAISPHVLFPGQYFEDFILSEDTNLFERNAEMMVAEMDGDLVMMDVDLGTYFAINPVGGHIWTQLETGQSLDQLITSVQASFASNDRVQIKADVEAFLADLTEHKLIRTVEAT